MASSKGIASLLDVAFLQLKTGRMPDGGFLLLLLSKALGLVMLFIGCTAKLPQIRKLYASKSGKGMNLLSLELETCGFSIITAYGFLMALPLTSFGEVVLLLGQQLVVLALAYKYSNAPGWRQAVAFTVLAGFATLCFTGNVSQGAIKTAYTLNILNLLGGRLPQIYQNWKNKNTGSLSGAMFNLNFTACCIRVFTSWAEGAGATMLRAYCLTGLLHGTTAAQIAYYSPEQKGTGSTARSSRTKAKAKVT